MKIAWRIIKYILLGILLAAAVALFVGIYASKPPAEMTKIVWNDHLAETYKNSDERLRFWYISEFEKNYSSDDGKFNISKVRYCPDAEQWQFTVGCNNSTVKDLAESLGTSLDADKENFRFVVTDQDGNIYSEYDYLYATKLRHNFRRLVFDGIPQNGVSKLTLCIYYTGDTSDGTLPDKPISKIVFYNSHIRLDEWNETDGDKPDGEKNKFTHCEALTLTNSDQSEDLTDDN